MQTLLEELQKLNYQIDSYKEQKLYFLESLAKKQSELVSLSNELLLNAEVKEYYNQAVEIIYQNSIGKLQDSINSALQYIFYDKDFKIIFELGSSRSKTLKLYLEENGRKINLKHGAGAGVRSVVSFIFLVYYLLSKKSYPVLFLDESYYQISSEYVERFFEFIQKIIVEKNFSIIIITHDQRFINYADHRIHIIDGKLCA